MIKIKSIIITLSVILGINFSYAETQTHLFTFLKSLTTGTDNVSGTVVMNNYLTGNEDEYITEIVCDSARTHTSVQGIILGTIYSYQKDSNSSIKFIFNKNKLMKVNKITFYVNSFDNAEPKMEMYFNDDKIDMPILPKKNATKNGSATLTNITGNGISTSWITPNLDSTPMKELEIKNCYIKDTHDVQVLGFTVEYDGVTKDTETGVEELDADTNVKVEYFDIMGRVLPAAPTNGLYIEKVGTKATKRFAH